MTLPASRLCDNHAAHTHTQIFIRPDKVKTKKNVCALQHTYMHLKGLATVINAFDQIRPDAIILYSCSGRFTHTWTYLLT